MEKSFKPLREEKKKENTILAGWTQWDEILDVCIKI